jgi:hypothetical protein
MASSMSPEKMILKITLVLASGRRIQAKCKDLVKVTVKLIKKGIHFQQTGSRNKGLGGREEREKHSFPVPHKGNGTKDSKQGNLLIGENQTESSL